MCRGAVVVSCWLALCSQGTTGRKRLSEVDAIEFDRFAECGAVTGIIEIRAGSGTFERDG
jgi:hypothetical protein